MSAGDDLLQLGIEPVKSRKAATLGEAGYARKERDFYPTEPWVTRTLIRYIDDAKGVDFAEAHIEPDRLEEFIAALRKAKADAEAYRRGLV